MFQGKKEKLTKRCAVYFTGALLLLGSAALASSKTLGDERITFDQAQEMAKVASNSSKFPILVNELVLEQLNRYLGTAQGRRFIKDALARMETYQPMIEKKLDDAHLPREILALPIVESGYRNRPDSGIAAHGAGLWMFIKPTARNFGLRVDAVMDERLDVEKETDAALRYLEMNKLRFNNWHLALMAYNMGEEALEKAIKEVGSRDPWVLIRAGKENDNDYLAKCLAAILIMKNPSAID